MASGMIEIMKRAALDAIESSQPTDLRFGTVVGVNPLRVKVSNQLTLPTASLIVPQHLTNYNVSVGLLCETNANEKSDSVEEHTHPIEGVKTMTIYNALQIGDKVALLRNQGGQSYFILDRI